MEGGGKVGGGTREGIVVCTGFFFYKWKKGRVRDGSPLTPFDLLLIQEVILDKKIITQRGAMASPIYTN